VNRLRLLWRAGPGDELVGELAQNGWRVESAEAVASTPESYLEYVAESAGEFSCAKGLYVGAGPDVRPIGPRAFSQPVVPSYPGHRNQIRFLPALVSRGRDGRGGGGRHSADSNGLRTSVDELRGRSRSITSTPAASYRRSSKRWE